MLLFLRCPVVLLAPARILLCLRPEGAINLISTLQNKKPNGTKKKETEKGLRVDGGKGKAEKLMILVWVFVTIWRFFGGK